MTDDEFMAAYYKLKDAQMEVKKFLEKKNGELHFKFLQENTEHQVGKVYEVQGKSHPRGMNRFVIYGRDVEIMFDAPWIRARGWWLDKNNKPAKSGVLNLYGPANPAILILSDNQENLPTKDLSRNY